MTVFKSSLWIYFSTVKTGYVYYNKLKGQTAPRKLRVAQLVKKSPSLYVTRKSIITLTKSPHWPLSWTISIQSTTYFLKIHLITSLSSTSGSPELSISFTHFLTQWITIAYLVKKFPAFYETRMFIIVFKRSCHWILSWARWIQSTPLHPIYLRSIVIFVTVQEAGFRLFVYPAMFHTKCPLFEVRPDTDCVCLLHDACELGWMSVYR